MAPGSAHYKQEDKQEGVLMLPNSIIYHPYFHKDIEEAKAFEILKRCQDKSNFLFCHGKKPDEFLLCYKAKFKGQEEIRKLIFSYSTTHKIMQSSSLGKHPTLYAAAQQLSIFLKGYADEAFLPMPIYNNTINKQLNSKLEQEAIPGLINDVTSQLIFPKLPVNSLFNAVQVAKNWQVLINKNLFNFFKSQDDAYKQKQIILAQKAKFIFDRITNNISPHIPDTSKFPKELSYDGCIISEPEWYSSDEILCKINSAEYHDQWLFVSKYALRWANDLLIDERLYEQLENTCRNGANRYGYIEEDLDSEELHIAAMRY